MTLLNKKLLKIAALSLATVICLHPHPQTIYSYKPLFLQNNKKSEGVERVMVNLREYLIPATISAATFTEPKIIYDNIKNNPLFFLISLCTTYSVMQAFFKNIKKKSFKKISKMTLTKSSYFSLLGTVFAIN